MLRLVQNTPCSETIDCLEQLLELARSGELIGVAHVGLLRCGKYFVDAAGDARHSPTFTRGALRALDEKLGRAVRGDSPI